MKELNKKTKHTSRSIKEAWGTKSDKPTNKTFVMYACMIHVEGFKSIKAKSDGTCAVISTNDGEVTITEPGNYFVSRGGSGLALRPMNASEVSKYSGKLSKSEVRKLEKERKLVHEAPGGGAAPAPPAPAPPSPEPPAGGEDTASSPSASDQPEASD